MYAIRSYYVEVTGSPSFTCEIEPRGEDGDHNTAGILGTAMRVVNAIPAVCAAPPGVTVVVTPPSPRVRAVLEEGERFLKNRADQGFNVVIIPLVTSLRNNFV